MDSTFGQANTQGSSSSDVTPAQEVQLCNDKMEVGQKGTPLSCVMKAMSEAFELVWVIDDNGYFTGEKTPYGNAIEVLKETVDIVSTEQQKLLDALLFYKIMFRIAMFLMILSMVTDIIKFLRGRRFRLGRCCDIGCHCAKIDDEDDTKKMIV